MFISNELLSCPLSSTCMPYFPENYYNRVLRAIFTLIWQYACDEWCLLLINFHPKIKLKYGQSANKRWVFNVSIHEICKWACMYGNEYANEHVCMEMNMQMSMYVCIHVYYVFVCVYVYPIVLIQWLLMILNEVSITWTCRNCLHCYVPVYK